MPTQTETITANTGVVGTIPLRTAGTIIPLTNCKTCRKLKKTQTTKHTARNCPHKQLLTASKSSTVQLKSDETVTSEDEEERNVTAVAESGRNVTADAESGNVPVENSITESGIEDTPVASTSSSRPANSSSSDTSIASTASSSRDKGKRPATSSSSSPKKRRQQQEVVSDLDCQEDVTIHVLNGDLQRWSNRDILMADTAKLLRNFHNLTGATVDKKNARLMRALYLLYMDIQSKKGKMTLYKGKSLKFEDFMTEVLKEAGLGKAEAEKKATKLYNQFKAGQTYHQLLISRFKLDDFPIQTVAMNISAATGRTNGTTVPDKKRLYKGRPFNPVDIPKLYEEMLKEYGRPPDIEQAQEFLKKNVVKQDGDEEEEKKKPPTKDEIIEQLQQTVGKLEENVVKLEGKLEEVLGEDEMELLKKGLEETEESEKPEDEGGEE